MCARALAHAPTHVSVPRVLCVRTGFEFYIAYNPDFVLEIVQEFMVHISTEPPRLNPERRGFSLSGWPSGEFRPCRHASAAP